MIGEQGREVLKEVGYSDEKIESMLENGTLYIWKDEE
jgi:cinnamoyl-CoA:phenyllactate CoA-transferase